MSNYKLKPSIKKKWVEALRNGGYVKTDGRLYRQRNGIDCFCAMGVLVNETAGFYPFEKRHEYANEASSEILGVPSKHLLPKVFKKGYVPAYWNALKLQHKNIERSIYELNDDEELSFNEIADLIEEQL